MSTLIAWAGDNAIQIDVEEGLARLEKECPQLLQPDERIIMAFKDRGGLGRDDSFFTSKRILIRDKKRLTGKKVKYTSIPYSSIKAYSIETAGSLDTDSTLKITSGSGVGRISIDFVSGSVDMFAIKRHLNEMVLVGKRAGADVPDGAVATTDVPENCGGGGILDWLGDDSSQINAAQVEEKLKSDPCILMKDEKVELAFKCGRDSFILTSKRFVKIDVQGISGKRVEYLTIRWDCLKAFSVETPGSFDRDSDLMLFTNITNMTRIEIDLRKGKSDVYAVQKFFADKILGLDTADAAEHAVSAAGYQDTGSGSLFSWIGDDSRMVDATKMNQQYHSNPPILQNCENVEMAFKGRRDLVLFTSKRLLLVDTKGWSGKRVDYMSIPWSTVQAFGVCSSGSFMDKDSEMMIWTDFNDIFYSEDDPPSPRNSFIELDFQKDKVDLMAVQRYLSERCLRVEDGGYRPSDVPVSQEIMQASPPGAVENFLSWLGNDAQTIDANQLNQQLHDTNPMLQADEHVVMGFKAGRDMLVLTSKRVLIMDTKGFSGKRIKWISVPYPSIRAYSVESAGSWDTDAELKLFCKIYWYDGGPGGVIEQDLRKGRVDIIAVQSMIAAQVIGNQDGSPALAPGASAASASGVDTFLSWIGDDAVAVDAGAVNDKLHTSPPILQSDESVDLCFKTGRDMCIFTTKRILFVDRQGFTGKKVEYMSYPLRYCIGFSVQSAGSIALLSEAKATVYTDVPAAPKIKQDLKSQSSDIWAIQTMLADKILKH